LNHLTLLLIEDSSEFVALVEHWVSTGDHPGTFTLAWTDTLAAGLNRLAHGGIDVILLDLGLPDSNGAETFARTKAQAPEIPIIILSAADSEPLALEMIQEGAADYLVKSTCNAAALIRAVRYAVVRHRFHAINGAGGRSPEPRIVGVIGVKGGVGTTTVACNLALELRRQTGHKVLLADLDVNAGLVSLMCGLDARFSMLDVVNNIHRLDATCWEAMVSRHIEDVDMLPSPALLGGGELSRDAILQTINSVRPFYDWIVLDLGRLDALATFLLERLSDLLVVSATSIPALYATRRVVDALLKAGIEEDRLRLVVNQMNNEQAPTAGELNQTFGVPVYSRLCAAREELDDACSCGKLPAEGTPFRTQIAGLARKLAGLPERKSERSLAFLFSLARRFRKNSGDTMPVESR
jgi:Flp pilus assembly CpaE family ATPase